MKVFFDSRTGSKSVMLFYRINIRRGHTPTHVKKKIKLTLKQIVGLISIISDM